MGIWIRDHATEIEQKVDAQQAQNGGSLFGRLRMQSRDTTSEEMMRSLAGSQLLDISAKNAEVLEKRLKRRGYDGKTTLGSYYFAPAKPPTSYSTTVAPEKKAKDTYKMPSLDDLDLDRMFGIPKAPPA